MLINEFKKLFEAYKKEIPVSVEELNTEIEVDLEDKGFSNEEINEIISNDKISNTTMYKAIAYFLLLFDIDWDTIKELKNTIKFQEIMDIENLTDEDLKGILKYRDEVDF